MEFIVRLHHRGQNSFKKAERVFDIRRIDFIRFHYFKTQRRPRRYPVPIIYGLFKALFVAVCATAGYYIGKRLDEKVDFKEIFARLFGE